MTSPRHDRVEANLREGLAGQYKVEGEFARGAMARLFLAKDLRHDRTVVIKVLPPDLATSSSAERFLREIRITAVLQHPNVLPLLDSGASGGLCWYAMPHVEGASLRQRLSEGPLPVRDALRIAIAVAQALEYAHHRGIIHRDIKPENILFSSGQPMVADFGLARAVAGTMGSGITATGLPLGTPAYMSPEQATGSTDIDHRADLYGLGCILFEMLVGRPPFGGRSVMDVIRAHMEAKPPSASQARPGIPSDLDRIVAKLMAKSPGDRYQDASEVLPDLENALARVTVSSTEERKSFTPISVDARTPELAPAPPSPGKPAPRRVGLWIGVAAVVALLGVLAVWRFGTGGAPAPAGPITVAVLPLTPVGGDSLTRVAAEGLAEELVAELLNRGGTRVTSPLSAGLLRSRGLGIRAIGDSLGVQHLFHGEVAREGDQVRISLQLVHIRDDAAEWGRSWNGTVGGLLSLRETVAREAADALLGVAGREK